MRVLYLGAKDATSTSRHRAEALRRRGCEVDHLDPADAVRDVLTGMRGKIHYRTGYTFTQGLIARWVMEQVDSSEPPYDLCWVDSGELLGPSAIALIRQHCGKFVLFNHDDPTGPRDRIRFITLKRAIPSYDLCVAVRDFNVPEFKALGAKDVVHVWRSFDEVAHRPLDPLAPVKDEYKNDVVFIGRCMTGEGRDLLMLELIKRGLKPAIWGDNWQGSKVWAELKPYWRGNGLHGQDYVDAIRGAKVCIGMLSKGNRDLHTTRSMEIPAAGGLLCAERTTEHERLYRDGVEAVFWSSAKECAELCRQLIDDPTRASGIRAAGHQRVSLNKVGNEDICNTVFQRLNLV